MLKERLLSLLYPPDVCCAVCGREAVLRESLCEECEKQLMASPARAIPPGLSAYMAVWCYEEPLRGTIWRFKYNNMPYLADFLSSKMRPPEDWGITEIVPVPLYSKKQAKRGYNQSALLARRIGARSALSVHEELLLRIKDTQTQTELSEAQRRENLKDAFFAPQSCEGKTILLIDDVCTTGSTLSACAAELLRAGAKRVCGMTAAATSLRTPLQ